MELPTKRSIGGGLLLTAGAVLGREFIFWAFGKVLDAGASFVRSAAKGMTMPSNVPWVDAFSLLLMAVGGWLLISGRRKTAEPSNAPEPVSMGAAPNLPLTQFIKVPFGDMHNALVELFHWELNRMTPEERASDNIRQATIIMDLSVRRAFAPFEELVVNKNPIAPDRMGDHFLQYGRDYIQGVESTLDMFRMAGRAMRESPKFMMWWNAHDTACSEARKTAVHPGLGFLNDVAGLLQKAGNHMPATTPV